MSLISEAPNVIVESSTNLRWGLDGLHVDPVKKNTLRNEFVEGTDQATIHLTSQKRIRFMSGLLQTPLFYTSLRCVTIRSSLHPAIVAFSIAHKMVL